LEGAVAHLPLIDKRLRNIYSAENVNLRRSSLGAWICFYAALATFSTRPASFFDRVLGDNL
jgi:hypothetical protein